MLLGRTASLVVVGALGAAVGPSRRRPVKAAIRRPIPARRTTTATTRDVLIFVGINVTRGNVGIGLVSDVLVIRGSRSSRISVAVDRGPATFARAVIGVCTVTATAKTGGNVAGANVSNA